MIELANDAHAAVSPPDLKAAHAALAAHFNTLSGKLKRAVVALESGEPPADISAIASEMESVRADFYALRAGAVAEARYHQLSSHTSAEAEPPKTLGDIEQVLHAVAEARERKEQADRGRMKLCAPLETVLEIRHGEQADFAPLDVVRQQAADLRRRITQATWPNTDMDALSRETKPFATLLSLVRGSDEYDDAEWDTMQATVESEFGRALAVALVRGRLTLGQSPGKSSFSLPAVAASPFATPGSPGALAPKSAREGGGSNNATNKDAGATDRSDRKTIAPDILPYLSAG